MLTPEQRDRHPLCGAKKKNGDSCRAFAGQSTDHPGVGRCKFHGGSTATHAKHAINVEAKQRMVRLGVPLDDLHPIDALLGMVRLSAGHVAFLNREIATLEDITTREAEVLVSMYDQERERLVRAAKAAADAGVDEMQIKLQSAYAQQVAEAIGATLDAIQPPLTDDQKIDLGNRLVMELSARSDAELQKNDPDAIPTFYGAAS